MNYFLRRILLFFPTLIIISIIIFGISTQSQIDPQLSIQEMEERGLRNDLFSLETKYNAYRQKLGINKPTFYLSIQRKSSSDTLHNINIDKVRSNIDYWSYQLGSWEKTDKLYLEIKEAIKEGHNELFDLLLIENVNKVIEEINKSDSKPFSDELLNSLKDRSMINNYIPTIRWNGTNNQYHDWISGILKLDLGRSTITQLNVSTSLKNAIGWTLVLSTISLIIALLIAIPLAVHASINPGGTLDNFCSTLFFSLYSLPVFWIGSLLLIYFASEEHLHWFPSFGVGETDPSMSLWEILQLRIAHLTLPLICWTYGSLAFIYRQLRAKMIFSLKQDYSLAAKAKGLSNYKVAWRHAFKNSKFPLITLLGASLPALITGSFVIESIFSIPGMGKLTIDAFLQRDFPLIHSISLMACILTILGIFIADLAYHYSDPRIKYQADHE